MKNAVFTGSGVAIVTPFKDGFVDYETMGALVEEQISGGSDAIIVCGTTGEASTMSTPEHLATVEFVVKTTAGRIPVIAGTGSNDTPHAVEMSRHAEASGADALLIVTPYYNKTTQHGLIRHYNYIADRVNIPIILYNVPSRTGMSFTAEVYGELAKHPNIVGVKEASGSLSLVLQTRYSCPDDFFIWSGDDSNVVPMMSIGAKGVISVAANIVPDVMAKMCRLCLEGQFREAAELQIRYADLFAKLMIEVNPVPVKTAMNILGRHVGSLRMPLCEMTSAHEELLRKAMLEVGLS